MINSEKIYFIWGLGPIGASTATYLLAANRSVIGIDPNPVTHGAPLQPAFISSMTDADLGDVARGRSLFTAFATLADVPNHSVATNCRVHIVCVPTELDGVPYMGIAEQVIEQIFEFEKGASSLVNVIVESTLTPGFYSHAVRRLASSKGICPDMRLRYGHSPRRDWFGTGVVGVRSMARVIGSNNAAAKAFFEEMLSPIWTALKWASSVETAEMVKPTENAFRYLAISFAHQISAGFPEVNIDEVLALAGTKWNVDTYHVGMGTGGYCIPLSTRYLLASPNYTGGLTLANEAMLENNRIILRYLHFLQENHVSSLCIIGLRYRPMFSSAIESPAVKLALAAHTSGMKVSAFDSLVNVAEVLGESFVFEQKKSPSSFDAIVVHACEKSCERELLAAVLAKSPSIVIDNREDCYTNPLQLAAGSWLVLTRQGLPNICESKYAA